MNEFLYKEFIFSPKYRVWRHVIYWSIHLSLWTLFWIIMGVGLSFPRMFFNMLLWLPVFICFSYPLVYWAIPKLLLNGKVIQFFLLILAWGAIGLYINFAYRTYVYVPIQIACGFEKISPSGSQPHSYLCMTTSAASPMIIRFFKLWTLKQRDLIAAKQEKITAELQLLKAQVHPHFLFNTLNNIYSFSLENSPKTPGLVLKLSSLLSYMLYDCNAEFVRLEKEVEIMKNYIDLERERYGNKIEISWSVEGEIGSVFIAPLIILAFLENAFKHGVSDQIEKPWLSVDIDLKQDVLRCKIANSKNEFVVFREQGIGINNVRKRLELIYPGEHDLKLSNESDFYVVSMTIRLTKSVTVAANTTEPFADHLKTIRA